MIMYSNYRYFAWCFCLFVLLDSLLVTHAKGEASSPYDYVIQNTTVTDGRSKSEHMSVEFIHNLVYRLFPKEEEASFFLSQIKFTLYPTNYSPSSSFHNGREKCKWNNARMMKGTKNKEGKSNLYLHTPTKDYTVPEYFTICPRDGDDVLVGHQHQQRNGESRDGPEIIEISANSKSALSQGMLSFIKDYLNQDISWGRDGTGNSLDLSVYMSCNDPKEKNSRAIKNDTKKKNFPIPKGCVKNTSPLPFRYYMNVCTVSYTMAFWDWKHWEKELDWMALSGINFALAFTGQEIVWLDLFEEFGISKEDTLKSFLAGPAFFAWQRMGNLKAYGGPLPMDYVHQQAELQVKILERMIELGINPILPAFAGFVPDSFSKVYPNASVTPSQEWNGFDAALLLEPGDNIDLFISIGKRFIELQQERYGQILHPSSIEYGSGKKFKIEFDYVQYYNTDTYNEMDPKSSDPEYLQASTKAVMDSIKAADPSAKWIMQGWLFHSDFWTDENIANYLKGVADTDMIILDLNSEESPIWPTFVENNKPFIWCLLHNYGGRRALYGNLDHYALQPKIDFKSASSDYMLGIGLTPEAIEQNPIVYELMLETPWIISDDSKMNTYSDVPIWIQKYVTRRYNLGNSSGLKKNVPLKNKLNGALQSIQEGWNLLHKGVYGNVTLNHHEFLPIMVKQPDPYMNLDRQQNITKLVFGLEKIASGAKNLVEIDEDNDKSKPSSINGPFQYDLVDMGRQYVADLFSDFGVLTDAIYTDATENPSLKWNNEVSRIQSVSKFMIQMFDDLDLLLSTDVNYLLGPWINDALYISNIHSDQELDPNKALFEFNARNQVTLWGPIGNIDDYASKQWAGLMKDYHKKRYEIYFNYLTDAIKEQKTLDKGTYHDEVLEFGIKWCNDTSTHYPTSPIKDISTLDVVLKLLEKYSPNSVVDEHYIKYEDADLEGEDILKSLQGTSAPGKSFWTRDIRQLALICDLDSDCIGFNNKGILYRENKEGKTIPTEGLTSFLKK